MFNSLKFRLYRKNVVKTDNIVRLVNRFIEALLCYNSIGVIIIDFNKGAHHKMVHYWYPNGILSPKDLQNMSHTWPSDVF